ncbi:hypothetical protein EJ05DRAFT_490518 [Pseudovirgaria hyperparasitica]|uniref:Transcription factor domain-containing protein n=1 Tax=Pseudovirgaria hyperparasitica TaxID=470096 RepID=A0A6A6VRT4_9PEZI|nr:uncharacterized protein EJ05DRAFT_490518 [Pseudovirgaria hyperparasitica]KAF2752913.1 hypothetical protein EJ05DRAFT_490518 [Pseudovirgaria hyperparasitica]
MAKYFNSIVPLSENYPLKIEEERGSLQIYGWGDGLTHEDEAQQVGSHASSKTYSETLSMCSTSDSGQASYGFNDKVNRLDFTPCTVNRLLASYLDHMHVFHPFLDKARLKKQVDAFRTDVDEGEPTAVPIYARPAQSHVRPPKTGGTITDAIILLVLALGAVLQEDRLIRGSLNPRNKIAESIHSPSTRMRYSPVTSIGLRSPVEDKDPGSPARLNKELMNLDVIPGLHYYAYAYASNILGNLYGGNEVYHAQAFLLASLYMNQLGRGLESYSWINAAARVIRFNLRINHVYVKPDPTDPSKYNRQQHPDNLPPGEVAKFKIKMNLLKFVYWSAVQLESDILAYLPLPTSHITLWEDRVAYPKDQPVSGETGQVDNQRDIIIVLFLAQIQFRKILNQVPMHLSTLWDHPPDSFPAGVYEPPFGREASTGIPSFLNWLYNWRNVSKAMGVDWDDYDDPSPDLNIARLRAEYYGAETIITRPYLHYVYHCPEADRDVLKRAWTYIRSRKASLTASKLREAEWGNSLEDLLDSGPTQSWDGISTKAIRSMLLSHTCMWSSIRSTKAFDGIPTSKGNEYFWHNPCCCESVWFKDLDGFAPIHEIPELLEETMHKCKTYSNLAPALVRDYQILRQASDNIRGLRASSTY